MSLNTAAAWCASWQVQDLLFMIAFWCNPYVHGYIACAGSATTQQAVMLTRCTGSLLVKRMPEERMALCDEVRKVLESVGEVFCWQ